MLMFVAAVFVVRLVGQLRRHHPFANKRFMARYRAEHPSVCRATVDARPLSRSLPVVRRRTPAGTDRVPPNRPCLPGLLRQEGAPDD